MIAPVHSTNRHRSARPLLLGGAGAWAVATLIAGLRAIALRDWSGMEAGLLPSIRAATFAGTTVPIIVLLRTLARKRIGRPTIAIASAFALGATVATVDVVQRAFHHGAPAADIALPPAIALGAAAVAVGAHIARSAVGSDVSRPTTS